MTHVTRTTQPWLAQHQRMMQELRRIKQRDQWIERNAWKLALVLVLLGIAMGGCYSLRSGIEVCPDGTLPTTWCGCEPPIYGSDC